MFQSRLSVSEAVRLLERACSFGLGAQPTQQEMLKTIEKIEGQYSNTDSAELQYWLGGTWRCYTAWFIRGEERKSYLQKALIHLEKAYTIEASNSGVKQNTYACHLGSLLVEEALIRNLERGIQLLETVFKSTSNYEPLLCNYAEALYKSGDYQKSADVATELHRRARESKEWKNSIPPAPMRIATKAYRALARELKSGGKLLEAVYVSTRLLDTGFATDNDHKVHKKLAQLVNGTY